MSEISNYPEVGSWPVQIGRGGESGKSTKKEKRRIKRNWMRRKRAVYLLTALNLDPESVAFELGVAKSTVNRWLNDSEFRAKVDAGFDRLSINDNKVRSFNSTIVSNGLYDEIHHRMADGESLKEVSLPALIKMLKDINYEVRLDSGDPTSNDKKTISIEDLVNRHENSVSAKYVKKLQLIEMPSEDSRFSNGSLISAGKKVEMEDADIDEN